LLERFPDTYLPAPEVATAAREVYSQVLARLRPDSIQLLRARYGEQRSLREIGAAENVSVSTAWKYLQRARNELREVLEELLGPSLSHAELIEVARALLAQS
jgi:DNA-directed RNA polymerase specialized sigma24 family protein